jgi:hypothetical protein
VYDDVFKNYEDLNDHLCNLARCAKNFEELMDKILTYHAAKANESNCDFDELEQNAFESSTWSVRAILSFQAFSATFQ